MRDHRVDRGLLAVELLPDHGGAARTGQHVRPRGIAIGTAERNRIGKRSALVLRASVEQPLAGLAVGVPAHVIGARGRDRKTGAMMRARGNLPVVVTDAVYFARCRRISECHDRVIPHTAFEDVPENDDGTAGAGECQTEPAAFAGVVACQPRLGISSAAVLRRREEQPCPFVFLALLLRGYAVALVDPGREHRTIRIEPERCETLALVA